MHAPQLPSAKYQFSTWYELDDACNEPRAVFTAEKAGNGVRGSELSAPRIRLGPANVPSFYALHSMMYNCKEDTQSRNAVEDWENAKSMNLSFQGLGDAYQRKNLVRCLNRLVNCTHLQLMDNSLTDLSGMFLTSCTQLNLAKNLFSNFKRLPRAPLLDHLNLSNNNIRSLSGLAVLHSKYPNLRSLVLHGNDCEYYCDYRLKIFTCLPGLEDLDGYPNLNHAIS